MTQAAPLIRPFSERDSLEELTALLHLSYAVHIKQGFNYSAIDQSVEATARRIARGECWVAETNGKIVGTATLTLNLGFSTCPWYQRENVAMLSQFVIAPALQKNGMGSRLLYFVENRAANLGYAELALDTAEGATQLVQWYQKRGYRFIENAQWQGKAYRSVILSKSLSQV